MRAKRKKLHLIYPREQEKQIGELLETLLFETSKLCDHILEAESVEYSEELRVPFLMNPSECKIAELFIDPFKMDERIRWNNWTKVMRYYLINVKHMITVYAINDKYL